MSKEISPKLQKCLDCYDALSETEKVSFLKTVCAMQEKNAKKPVDPAVVEDALSKFKSMTLKIKSSRIKGQVDSYKWTKKKNSWECVFKEGKKKPMVIVPEPEDAEDFLKQIFKFGVLNWDKVFWPSFATDGGEWTLDITFKDRPKFHVDGGCSVPDHWDDFKRLFLLTPFTDLLKDSPFYCDKL